MDATNYGVFDPPQDLNTLYSTNSGFSGFTTVGPHAINDGGAIVGTATYSGTNSAIAQGPHGVLLLPVEITSVSFDGDKYWQLESDTTDASGNYTQYSKPQWTDTNGSTNTTDPGVHNYAVAYTCNAIPKIGATFRIPGASNWSSLKFKATGSDGISIPATAGTVGSDGVTVTMQVTASTTALPANTVKFYNWADNTAFTLNWSISVDGGTTWSAINSTKHSVYVTLADPNVTDWNTGATERQLTLFDTACRQATGLSDPGTIVNKVYSVFTNQVSGIPTVQCINPSTSQPSGSALTYWGPAATQAKLCWTTPGLLSTGDARCGGWAQFFHDALLVNGISSTVEVVDPPENNPHDSPWKTSGSSLYAPALSKLQNDITNFLPDTNLNDYQLIDIIFYVKNWNLSMSTTSPFAPVKPNGVAGQGGAGGAYPSATYFNNHAIVEYGGNDYDPSYGSPMASSRTIWENNALSGYGAIIENTTTGVQYKWIWKPETQGTQDTIFFP
jgi:hypothetical protein